MRSYYRYATIISLAIMTSIAFYLFSSDSLISKEGHYELKNDAKKRLMKFQNIHNTTLNTINYVSIAQLDRKYFVIANYLNLFLLNRDNSIICVLKPEGLQKYNTLNSLTELSSVLKNSKLSSKINLYNPTGVFIDHQKNLYVANYKGNNILKGKIKPESCEVEYIKEYSSDNTKGPENIAVDNQRNILVSANYDSGTITAHHLENGQELWSTNVGQAHGITIAGSKVYATGLTERKIYELNVADGKITNSKGSLGWDPMKSQYLWPTSIYAYDKNTLVVSDPHSGFISFVDKRTLDTLRYTGGNGPSYRWLNYPYAAMPINNGLVVLSSMRGHLLFLDKSGKTVKENLLLFKDNWPNEAILRSHFGYGWEGYVNEIGPRIKIRNEEYKLGYGHLYPVKKGPILRVPDINTLFNFDEYIFFLQGAYEESGSNLFFSSSSETLLGVVNQQGKPDVLLNRKIPLDSWLVEKKIINTKGMKIYQPQLIKEFQEYADKLHKILSEKNWISSKDFYEENDFRIQERKLKFIEFNDYFNKVFVSPPGLVFKRAYDQCNESSCNIKMLQQAAKQYYFEAQVYAYLNLDEYLLVGMLSGINESKTLEKTKVSYHDCGKGNYYDGYGVNALVTETLNDYLSAYDINTSYVCFNQNEKKKATIKNIRFAWYSKDEVPKRIALYGIKNPGNKQLEILIGNFDIVQVEEIDGYLYSTVKLSGKQNFDHYMIRVLEGGQQNRLILRRLELVFDSNDNGKMA